MKLQSLKIHGFRSFNNPIEIDFDKLTMLIGNNDIGKSSIIDILEIALNQSKKPNEKDYFIDETGATIAGISIILTFVLEGKDEKVLEYAMGNFLTYRAIFSIENSIREYLTKVPKNPDFRCDFSKKKAPEQKDFIQKYDRDFSRTSTNVEKRCEWFNNFLKKEEMVEDWKEIPNDFMKLLPRIQRFSAMDYSAPEKLIDQTIRQVFESVLYEKDLVNENEEKILKKSLKEIEIEASDKINKKISDLNSYIKKYAPNIENITYEPQIDFSRGFQSGEFKVNEGNGEHYLDRSGDGTKRKVFMATTDWDRDVTITIQSENSTLPDIIRAYDEPDTNLDFQAQRQLYNSINEIVENENSNIQAIICTHSPRMIDRAPAQSIRMLKHKDQKTIIEKLDMTDSNDQTDDEIESFLSKIAKELGITNSLMFYENCYIIIEGDTEQNALPLFYHTIYHHSLLEDGINLINVHGKGAFKEFLKLLSKNKKELVLFLMDKDCETSKDDKLTKRVLSNCGFDEDFCNKRVKLVGTQEFEDLFSKTILTKIYNQKWPKIDGQWVESDFPCIQNKYSDELKNIVWNNCSHEGEKWSKPELGFALGKTCTDSDIPDEIKELFKVAREIAGIVEM